MKNYLQVICCFALITVLTSCASSTAQDKATIVSIILNELIGEEEYYAGAPPTYGAYPPDDELLETYSSFEEAEKELVSEEWKVYFEHIRTWEAWEERMKKVDRKLIFHAKDELDNRGFHDILIYELNENGFDDNILHQGISLDIQHLQNNTPYSLVQQEELEEFYYLDSTNVAVLEFSEISYNTDKSKAAIYWSVDSKFNFIRKNIAYFEKTEAGWELDYQDYLLLTTPTYSK